MQDNLSKERRCLGCMELQDGSASVCPHCGWRADAEDAVDGRIEPGSRLVDRYLIGKVLSADRFGISYMAYDELLDTKAVVTCAITKKGSDKFKKALGNPDGLIESIRQRADSLAGIPDVLPNYDTFMHKGELFVVAGWADGQMLEELVEDRGSLSYQATLRIMKKAAAIVDKMHKVGLLHGSISPESIIVDDKNEVHLLDRDYLYINFADSPRFFLRGGYSPLELYNSNLPKTEAMDVYAIAACFYYALVGEPLAPALDRDYGDDCPTPTQAGVNMPGDTEMVLINALAIRPAHRTQTAEEFFTELRDAGGTRRRAGYDVPLPPRTLPGYFKYILLGVAAVVLLLVCLLVAGVFDPAETLASVPYVVGMTIDDAQIALKDAGFRMLVEDAKADSSAFGMVLSQGVNSGTMQTEGDIITVVVSSGEVEAGTMPEARYDNIGDVFGLLNSLGADVRVELLQNDLVMPGGIIVQSLPAGSQITMGTDVTLTVSTGSRAMARWVERSDTIERLPATAIYISEGEVHFVDAIGTDTNVKALPAEPSHSDPARELLFYGWFSAENGKGDFFTVNTPLEGVCMLYAYFADESTPTPTLPPTPEPTPTPDETDTPTDEPDVTESPRTHEPELTEEPGRTDEPEPTDMPPTSEPYTSEPPTTRPPTAPPTEPPTDEPELTWDINSVTISPSNATLRVGQTLHLSVHGVPEGARVSFFVSDGFVATVVGNELHALMVGTTSVTVYVDGVRTNAVLSLTVTPRA